MRTAGEHACDMYGVACSAGGAGWAGLPRASRRGACELRGLGSRVVGVGCAVCGGDVDHVRHCALIIQTKYNRNAKNENDIDIDRYCGAPSTKLNYERNGTTQAHYRSYSYALFFGVSALRLQVGHPGVWRAEKENTHDLHIMCDTAVHSRHIEGVFARSLCQPPRAAFASRRSRPWALLIALKRSSHSIRSASDLS